MGIAFLAAVLERAGFETLILDFSVYPYSTSYLKNEINRFDPAMIGVTAVTMTFNDAIAIIADAKRINEDLLTVMGGPHVTFCAEETLQSHPYLDLIVLGEGEETIVEIAEALSNNRDWQSIKGLVFRDKGEIVFTEKRALLDVNKLPLPARHLLPLERYRALHTPISMTTSRGCPFKCIFCVGRQMVGAKVRYRDPNTVVDELEFLSLLDFPQINIADDLFTANHEHCTKICNEIIRRQLRIQWSSFARVDTINPSLLSLMKRAGCKTISFGVETANPQILKTIKKGITTEKAEAAVRMCRQAGIQAHFSFILGLPGETPETLAETQKFGKRLQELGGLYGFHLLAPFPGTAVRDQNKKYDLAVLTDDWSQYHANRAIVETSSVSKDMLDAVADKWDQDTRAHLADIKKKIEEGTATDEEAWQLVNLDRFLFIYALMMDQVLENRGMWQLENAESSREQLIHLFAQRIHSQMGQSLEKTRDILDYAMKRECISYIINNNEICWRWNEMFRAN